MSEILGEGLYTTANWPLYTLENILRREQCFIIQLFPVLAENVCNKKSTY